MIVHLSKVAKRNTEYLQKGLSPRVAMERSKKLSLMNLTFSTRWEQVGEREDLEELLDPLPLEGHEKNFCRIAASQRNGDGQEWKRNHEMFIDLHLF
eukprot:s73_g13.t1